MSEQPGPAIIITGEIVIKTGLNEEGVEVTSLGFNAADTGNVMPLVQALGLLEFAKMHIIKMHDEDDSE